MELDKRIIDRKYIYDCFNADMAKEFIGEDCYMTNDIELFQNLDRINVYKLDRGEDGFYNAGEDEYFDFCLPVRWVKPKEKEKEKEKKYRPFKDIREFFIKTNFKNDSFLHIRSKDKIEYWVMVVGWTNNSLMLGTENFTFEKLFENFEVENFLEVHNDEINFMPFGFIPFGVEVEVEE